MIQQFKQISNSILVLSFAGAISFDEEYVAAVDKGFVGIFNLKHAIANSDALLPLESTVAAQRARSVDGKIRMKYTSPTFQIPVCTRRTTTGQRTGNSVDVDRSNSIRNSSSSDESIRDLKWSPGHISNGRLLAVAHANSIDIWQIADIKSEKRNHSHYSEGTSAESYEINEQYTANNEEEVLSTNRGSNGPKLVKNIELFWPNSPSSSSCSDQRRTLSIDKSFSGGVGDTHINTKTSESGFESNFESNNTIDPARMSSTVSGEQYLIKSIAWHLCGVTSLIVFSTARDPIKIEISSDFTGVQIYRLLDCVGWRRREREPSSHPNVPSTSCGARESIPAIRRLGKFSEHCTNNSNGINSNGDGNGINNRSNSICSNGTGIYENRSEAISPPHPVAPSTQRGSSLRDSTAMSEPSNIESRLTGDTKGTGSTSAVSGIKSKIHPFGSVSMRSSLVACVDRDGVVTVLMDPLSDPVNTVKSKDRLEGSRDRQVKATCLSRDDRLVFVSSSISSPPSSSFLPSSSPSPTFSLDTISFTDLHCAVRAARPHTGLSTHSHTRFRHILAGDSLSSALYVPGPGMSSNPLISGSDTDTAPMSLVRPSVPTTLIPHASSKVSRDVKRLSGAGSDCNNTDARRESECGPRSATRPLSNAEGDVEEETPSCTDSNHLTSAASAINTSCNKRDFAIDSHSRYEPAVICVGSQRGALGVLDSLLSIRVDLSGDEGGGQDEDQDERSSRGGHRGSDCMSTSTVDCDSSERRRKSDSNTVRIADISILPTAAPTSFPISLPVSHPLCVTPAVTLPCSLNGNGNIRNSTHIGTHTGMNTGPCSALLPVCGEVVVHLLRRVEAAKILDSSTDDSCSDTRNANSSSCSSSCSSSSCSKNSSSTQQGINTDSTRSSSSSNSSSSGDLIEICRVTITDPLLTVPDLLAYHVLSSPQLLTPSCRPSSSSSSSSSTFSFSSLQSTSSSFQPSSFSSFSSSSSSSSLMSPPSAIIGLLAVASTQSGRVTVYSTAAEDGRITASSIGQHLVGHGQVKVEG
jgi:hypothetical protein